MFLYDWYNKDIQHSCNLISIILIAYISVLFHEYGHALTGKFFGYDTEHIVLYPLAGIATLKGDWWESSKHEFWITLMGPLTNLVLISILIPFVYLFVYLEYGYLLELVVICMEINLIIFLFNLIPIFPMDGGRLLRSILSSYLGIETSTKIVPWVGVCFLLISILFIGISNSIILLILLCFGFFESLYTFKQIEILRELNSFEIKSDLKNDEKYKSIFDLFEKCLFESVKDLALKDFDFCSKIKSSMHIATEEFISCLDPIKKEIDKIENKGLKKMLLINVIRLAFMKNNIKFPRPINISVFVVEH